mmetsp:Transcript_161811/g.519055  ORF Transcript_161811/g.519055 Transcript_161811/m.519055 type:complete len:218 (-) Transcript_161811:43-696(-)
MGAASPGGCRADSNAKSNELLCSPACGDQVAASLKAAQAGCEARAALDECTPVRLQGLNDQACADVLLVQASQRGDVQDLQKALSKGANVDTRANLCLSMGEAASAQSSGLTPLMRACACGHEDVILQLLEAKANPHRSDARRWNPLCHALASGEHDAARFLLRHIDGADRAKGVANSLRKSLSELCEESAGPEKAEELQAMFGVGGVLLMGGSRRV